MASARPIHMFIRFATISLVAASTLAAIDFPQFKPAPENWLDSKPREVKPNAGQFTLLFVFARDCINCKRTHAFMNQMQTKFGKAGRIIGVHSPEFAWEKNRDKLKRYATTTAIQYPIYMDNAMEIWGQLANRYWPAIFIFDKSGRHVETFIGEVHVGDANAQKIEAALKAH